MTWHWPLTQVLVAQTWLPSTQVWHEPLGGGGQPVVAVGLLVAVAHAVGLHTGAVTPQVPASQVAV